MTNTNTTVKTTKREYYNQLLEIEAVRENPNLIEFINHEIELLNRKHSSSQDEKKKAINEPIKTAIVEVLKNADKPMTVTEIIATETVKASKEDGVNSSKATAMLGKLQTEGKVIREEIKGKAYFSIK